MNITLHQATAFVEVLLGDKFVGENATKSKSPLVRAFLKGAMPNGCPSSYGVNGATCLYTTPHNIEARDHFCDFLEAVVYRLRHPKEEQEHVPTAQEEELKKLKGFVNICAEAWAKWFKDPDYASGAEMELATAIQEGLEGVGINTSPEEKNGPCSTP